MAGLEFPSNNREPDKCANPTPANFSAQRRALSIQPVLSATWIQDRADRLPGLHQKGYERTQSSADRFLFCKIFQRCNDVTALSRKCSSRCYEDWSEESNLANVWLIERMEARIKWCIHGIQWFDDVWKILNEFFFFFDNKIANKIKIYYWKS